MKRHEITIDLSRSSEKNFKSIISELVCNGYEVYESMDSFDKPNIQELCISVDNAREIKEV